MLAAKTATSDAHLPAKIFHALGQIQKLGFSIPNLLLTHPNASPAVDTTQRTCHRSSTIEDNEISQICSEPQLSHDEFVSVRINYRDQRAVSQTPPKPKS